MANHLPIASSEADGAPVQDPGTTEIVGFDDSPVFKSKLEALMFKDTTKDSSRSILPNGIYYYEGSEHFDQIEIDGPSVTFKRERIHPYGFYVFDSMEEFVLEDGTEWGMNKQKDLFSLFSAGDVPYDFNAVDELLSGYKEYMGSKRAGGSQTDFFTFNDKGNDLVIRLKYTDEDKNKVLPLFLYMISTIRYISDPDDFQSGVAIEFPGGGTENERAVYNLLKAALEALVDKNEEAFKETLEPSMREYFDYMLDPSQQRRYIKLEFEKPLEEDDQVLNAYVESEFLDPTKRVTRITQATYTVRKGKDGVWKIANID
ncbi:hypothetical protein [Paenibacillus sp. HB172176]|uniref:hypothetical protein n=1 Tax=Paenibacillus sp. HB172176 TaxID=2493690 RepID=UPI00143A6CEA|nr:hypothetical protein [Paenibacillus sp. HB172176]